MQTISKNNPLIVERSKLKDKKYRDEYSLFSFDGIKLALEAVGTGIELKEIFITEELYEKYSDRLSIKDDIIYIVTEDTIKKLSPDKAPDGVVCVADYMPLHTSEMKGEGSAFIAYDIQDPGNLGTIIRTARAFGIDEIILCGDCADIYNRRTVRASMGTLFKQSVSIVHSGIDAIDFYHKFGYKILAATLNDESMPIDKISIDKTTIFAVGNEGHGLPDAFIRACDGSVIIPMGKDAESLNASIASSILMWELSKELTK